MIDEESYYVGQKAALLAGEGEHGYMSTILRADWDNYQPRYDKAPLADVAEKDRKFPAHWISDDGTDVTDEFVKYARPLIGDGFPTVPIIDGRIRFAKLDLSPGMFAEQKLDKYVPQGHR